MNKRYALFTIVFLCLLALSSSLYYRTEISKEEKNTALNLKNLTETTSKALLHWIHERQGDAHIWSASKDLSARLEQYLLQPDTLKYKSLLLSRMELMLKAYDYSSLQLFDTQGQRLLSTGSKHAATEVTAHKIQQSLNMGTIERTAFYLSPSGTVCIDWVAPLFREQNQPQQAIAAVVLQVDTSHYLFPLIQDHPNFYTSQKVELYAIRGNKCWLLFNAYPQTTPDGRLIWDGIALDITEQKQAQETIEDSEKRLRTITNASRNGVIMIDNAGKISFCPPLLPLFLAILPKKF